MTAVETTAGLTASFATEVQTRLELSYAAESPY